MQFGLIGKSLIHSYSKKYFDQFFYNQGLIDYKYDLFEINEVSEIPSLIQNKNIKGLNITIPFKKDVIGLLDHISPIAKQSQAVNSIKILKNTIFGDNTDIPALEQSLYHFIPTDFKAKALILGSGASSRSAAYVLDKLNIEYKIVSRSGSLQYEDLSEKLINESKLIINTSPVGMFPHIQLAPLIPYNYITNNHYLFDLVYNPEFSLFLSLGFQKGAQVKNGLEMLHAQAKLSWEFWNS